MYFIFQQTQAIDLNRPFAERLQEVRAKAIEGGGKARNDKQVLIQQK